MKIYKKELVTLKLMWCIEGIMHHLQQGDGRGCRWMLVVAIALMAIVIAIISLLIMIYDLHHLM